VVRTEIEAYAADARGDGSFTVDAVAPGDGPIFAFVPGLAPLVRESVTTGANNVELRFPLPGRLSLRVLSTDGTPVRRFSVRVNPEDGGGRGVPLIERTLAEAIGPRDVASEAGEVTLEPLEPRRVRVEVTAPGLSPATTDLIVIPSGATAGPVEVRLASAREF